MKSKEISETLKRELDDILNKRKNKRIKKRKYNTKKKPKRRKRMRRRVPLVEQRRRVSVKKARQYKERKKEIVKTKFDASAEDFEYIIKDSNLLRWHIRYISRQKGFKVGNIFNKYVFDNDDETPRMFCKFKQEYYIIYERWKQMIDACYNKKNKLYKFFGAKGIRMSKKFLDARFFCTWCLKNGMVYPTYSYKAYLVRKDKHGNFSEKNCYVITEKELHECKSLSLALHRLWFIKKYEEGHHASVKYMTAYSRYYLYDFDEDDTFNYKYNKMSFGFSPTNFYKSVADESSCSLSTFLCRYLGAYGIFELKPYDVLKPDFSIGAAANSLGLLSYKQAWNRKQKNRAYSSDSSTNTNFNLNISDNSVYTNYINLDPYSEGHDETYDTNKDV